MNIIKERLEINKEDKQMAEKERKIAEMDFELQKLKLQLEAKKMELLEDLQFPHKVLLLELITQIKFVNSLHPRTRSNSNAFLVCVAIWYRHFIPDYDTKVHILNISSNSRTFTWTSEHQEKFQELQRTFFTKPFIVQSDWTKQFFLNTDGSHIAIAGILMQKQDYGELQPISYYSRTLTATESRYPANKIELLAIHNSVKYFREFLYGRKFTILLDHMNFKYHTNLQNPANIVARWLMDLSEYEFDFQHVKGKNNLLADYISREKHGHADMSADTIIPASMNTQTINAFITQELSDEIILAAQDADDDI
ncbi:retrovirus-related Pol polyprotein from transposon 297 [Nephila pilipes]|uniref:Retrovirus-related Pol polyprotein from transposon 297 n=1 Tax=Nephila pilipes TaxID=299642 RepID=A0A8X6QMM3_NEPPI|nr:retrovirus-related Pol polyprotein from transposon 297 [Nephila pilipes]